MNAPAVPPTPPDQRRRDILAYVIAYKTETQGRSPTVRQIGRATDISSTYIVVRYLEQLAARGCIEWVRDGGKVLDIRIPGAKWVAPDEVGQRREAGQ